MYLSLSDKAKSICAVNYKNNCGNCPLRPACTKTFVLSEDNHNKWIDGVNKLAETL